MSAANTTSATPAPPAGRQLEITGGGYRAVVAQVGAGLRVLETGTADADGPRPLILSYGPDESSHAGAGQLLAPWPNRVAGAVYHFDGEERRLDVTEPARGHAIHGLVRWLAWTVREHTADRVVLEQRLYPHPGYPHVLDLTAAYAVSEAGLEVTVSAHNVGANAAPYGYGAHPYLTPGVIPQAGGIDQWSLHLPAQRYAITDEHLVPQRLAEVDGTQYDFRGSRALAGTGLDTAFAGLQRELDGIGRVRLTEPGGGAVTLWMDRGLEWIQVFTGDALAGDWRRGAVAVEPMSCPPDAFNSGTDLTRLEPGERAVHRWGIHAG